MKKLNKKENVLGYSALREKVVSCILRPPELVGPRVKCSMCADAHLLELATEPLKEATECAGEEGASDGAGVAGGDATGGAQSAPMATGWPERSAAFHWRDDSRSLTPS